MTNKMPRFQVGDRVKWNKARYGDPDAAFGTVTDVSTVAVKEPLYAVYWETDPYPGSPGRHDVCTADELTPAPLIAPTERERVRKELDLAMDWLRNFEPVEAYKVIEALYKSLGE